MTRDWKEMLGMALIGGIAACVAILALPFIFTFLVALLGFGLVLLGLIIAAVVFVFCLAILDDVITSKKEKGATPCKQAMINMTTFESG